MDFFLGVQLHFTINQQVNPKKRTFRCNISNCTAGEMHGPVILCEKVDIKKVVLNKLELTKDCDNQRVKVCLHFWH